MADVRLIDVNAAIERAKESDKIVGSSIWETCEVVEFLEDCPIEDAVPVVHGRWIDTSPNYRNGYYNNAHKCSNCGDYYTTDPNDLYYCPRCGAKMDLEVPDGQA